jgi:hypothetical protein
LLAAPAGDSVDRPFDPPSDALVREARGRGSFVSRIEWQGPDGATGIWQSRLARKGGFVEVVHDGISERIHARRSVVSRLSRCNTVAGLCFFLGGGLFAVGAVLAQFELASITGIDWTFMIGGMFFSTGAYVTLLQEINSPRTIAADGSLSTHEWRWWSYEPHRPGWASAFVLLCGTLAFAVSLGDAFIGGLSSRQDNRLIWAPEIVGCVLFLISGHIAITEVCHGRLRWLPSSLGWWIVVINQVGSWLFMLSGLAAYIRPATGGAISPTLINLGTALGAACFSVAGLAQLFERPDPT